MTHNPNKPPESGGSKTYRNWRAYLASPEGQASFHPVTVELGNHQDLGTVGGMPVEVDVILVDGATPSNPNGCDPHSPACEASEARRGGMVLPRPNGASSSSEGEEL